ncbi:hypothetical protein HDU78_009968 [Chytriomyces hyalinus]|nr:hypothetical protein HDU78_009968 [Chytriomyces hyalinus]
MAKKKCRGKKKQRLANTERVPVTFTQQLPYQWVQSNVDAVEEALRYKSGNASTHHLEDIQVSVNVEEEAFIVTATADADTAESVQTHVKKYLEMKTAAICYPAISNPQPIAIQKFLQSHGFCQLNQSLHNGTQLASLVSELESLAAREFWPERESSKISLMEVYKLHASYGGVIAKGDPELPSKVDLISGHMFQRTFEDFRALKEALKGGSRLAKEGLQEIEDMLKEAVNSICSQLRVKEDQIHSTYCTGVALLMSIPQLSSQQSVHMDGTGPGVLSYLMAITPTTAGTLFQRSSLEEVYPKLGEVSFDVQITPDGLAFDKSQKSQAILTKNYKRLLETSRLDIKGLKETKPPFQAARFSPAGSSSVFLGSTPHCGQGCGIENRIKYSLFVQMVPTFSKKAPKVSPEGQLNGFIVAAMTDGYFSIKYFIEVWRAYLLDGDFALRMLTQGDKTKYKKAFGASLKLKVDPQAQNAYHKMEPIWASILTDYFNAKPDRLADP